MSDVTVRNLDGTYICKGFVYMLNTLLLHKTHTYFLRRNMPTASDDNAMPGLHAHLRPLIAYDES